MEEKKNEYDLILEKAAKMYREAKKKNKKIPDNFIEYIKNKNKVKDDKKKEYTK